MSPTRRIALLFYLLLGGSTLAGSLIWGIDALMLLDAGLSNTGVLAVNAGYMVGALLAEIPTGIIADTKGRRTSYMLGCISSGLSIALYISLWVIHAPLWAWVAMSALLGVSFSFFTGALEAWLVDAYRHYGAQAAIQRVLGHGQAVMGAAMLVGTIAGGYIAQWSSFAVPYYLRTGLLMLCAVLAYWLMRDVGFTRRGKAKELSWAAMQQLLGRSINLSLGKPAVRWLVLGSPLVISVNYYVFFALQTPYLLGLLGESQAYGVAGIISALTAVAHMVGGLIAPALSARLRGRVNAVIATTVASCLSLVALSVVTSFWVGVALCGGWALMRALSAPPRQAYLNEHIPSSERATVLSFDSMLGNAGSVPLMPVLGKAADMYGYGVAMAASGLIQLLAVPVIWRARRYDRARHEK